MSEYSSLTRVLAEALVDVVWFVEGCDDEQRDSDDAVKLLEGVGYRLGWMPMNQQTEFLGVIASMAEAEPDTRRREFIEQFPDAFGLLDGEV